MDLGNISSDLVVMTGAAAGAERFAIRDFGEIEQLQSSRDQGLRFAENGRAKIEKTVVEALLAARPKFGIMTPSQTIAGADISHRFIVNPIDGFSNFARGLPLFAITIALQEQKYIAAAVVYSPLLDKTFFASRGDGAFVAEARMKRRIRVSRRAEEPFLLGEGGRELGCASLSCAYVASGSADGYVALETSVFDLAAGALIVKEAGGAISAQDVDGAAASDVFGAARVLVENNYLQPGLKDLSLKDQHRGSK
ncbi:MAG: hypothetical protein LBL52_02375 [Rickettsiales bacterium]|jgi:myo-inositol-1(or 4)-monophosphatase|nr:hypothetical protein [Rickettsiales bacterium]